MSDTPDGDQIPVLYSIHHCCYDRYPNEADVLELSDETINAINAINAMKYELDFG